VEFVDLDDYKVPNKRLQCNSDDMDDDEAPNPEVVDVGDGICFVFAILRAKYGPGNKVGACSSGNPQ
jgi:hypothetical protein